MEISEDKIEQVKEEMEARPLYDVCEKNFSIYLIDILSENLNSESQEKQLRIFNLIEDLIRAYMA